MRHLWNFFDKLEDRIRHRLSHHPILYGLIGGVGAVLFWRGVWHTADLVSGVVQQYTTSSTIDLNNLLWWDGPLSLVLGALILLAAGIFVSSFIGNEIIITGLSGEKKLVEKTGREMHIEAGAIGRMRGELRRISEQLDELERPDRG